MGESSWHRRCYLQLRGFLSKGRITGKPPVVPPALPVSDGLVAWLDSEDGNNTEQTATWIDKSGNNNNMALTGFTFDATNGWNEGKLMFGLDQYGVLPLPLMNDNYTVEIVWEKPKPSSSPYGRVLHAGKINSEGSENFAIACGTTYGANIYSVFARGIINEGSANYTVDTVGRYVSVFVKSSTSFSYIENKAVKTTVNYTGNYPLEILKLNDRLQSFPYRNEFNIIAIRVYNKALSEAEISQNFDHEQAKIK